jgi:hypothetical protein
MTCALLPSSKILALFLQESSLKYGVPMKVKLKARVIRRILARKNVSQNWLALHVGTSSGYMSQLMAGTRNPSPHMREKILEVLKGHEFDDLFTLQSR